MKRALTVLLSSCCLLTSCVVGPKYKPDNFPVPAYFSAAPHPPTREEIAETEKDLRDWWALFQDPVLDHLVDRAIKGNYDLQVATQNILAYQALKRQASADWYPQMDANAGAGTNRYSIDIDNWPLRPKVSSRQHPAAAILTYGVTASWQLDVFGHIARQVEAQKRVVEESIEMRRGVLMSLLSDLVSDYVTLRMVQEEMDVVENSIKVAHSSTDMVERLYENGVGNTLSVAQARAEEHTERAKLPPLYARQQRLIYDMAMLMGEMPGTLEPELEKREPMPIAPAFPATVPSTVLINRPDIRQSERKYAESMARVGVAVTNLYPKFSIPLSFNPNASAFYQLAQDYAMAWNILMTMSVPVLHGGKLTAEISQARHQAEGSRLAYRQTVLNAFREVEDAMTDWYHDNTQVLERKAAATEACLARDRAKELFGAGLTPFLDVLNTQQNALSAMEADVVARGLRLNDVVALYVAMGAGWQGRNLGPTLLPVQKKKESILLRAFTR
ncbi:efflux transporter outer membrane subunit [Oecophyllibacter saccharovorans]|uniref:efflux transporter outer membrane subunit n=1 Tax=Oecophyllibacter saccharovorans TaxID=2558360 RepID=UPI001144E857|nr:efflux transporter outer membrane subunit [Oecophyllibacter saccharovorans]QDH15399.1 efflux transporter outer membrane subunit [Oecophyllibacter saccharovorans]TPW36418.1 efflux transporter outer membrane subunit [Oecophyllibacter saccharovorans]